MLAHDGELIKLTLEKISSLPEFKFSRWTKIFGILFDASWLFWFTFWRQLLWCRGLRVEPVNSEVFGKMFAEMDEIINISFSFHTFCIIFPALAGTSTKPQNQKWLKSYKIELSLPMKGKRQKLLISLSYIQLALAWVIWIWILKKTFSGLLEAGLALVQVV